jgi:hypothetical protein
MLTILMGRAARRASACSWIMWESRNGLLPLGSNTCSFELATQVGLRLMNTAISASPHAHAQESTSNGPFRKLWFALDV